MWPSRERATLIVLRGLAGLRVWEGWLVPRIALNAGNRKWWTLAAMTGAQSMLMVDATVVGLALPSIQRDLNVSTTTIQWVISAYMLTLAALLAIGGWLSDRIGPVRSFMTGAVVFTGGLVCSGASDPLASIELLLAARVVQGCGAALMIPAAQSIITDAFARDERGGAMGIWGSVSMIFMVLAPAAGGVVTQSVGWGWLFWGLIPFGVASIVLTIYVRPVAPPAEKQARFDRLGSALLVVGLVAFIFGLMQSSAWGWLDWRVIGLLVLGSLSLVGFVLVEPHRRDPLIEMRLFRSGNFGVAALIMAFIGAPATVTSIWGARYLQDVLEFSPQAAGLALMPLSVPLLLLSIPGGRLYDKLGPRLPLGIGLGALTVAMLFGALALQERDYAWLVPSLVLIGIGLAFASTPANTEGMNSAPEELRGEAAGALQTVGQAGNVLVVAIVTTLVDSIENAHVEIFLKRNDFGDVTAEQVEGLLAEAQGGDPSDLVNLPADQLSQLVDEVKNAFTSGVQVAYLSTAGLMAILLLLALARLKGRRTTPPTAPTLEESPP